MDKIAIIGLGYVGLPIFTRLQNKIKTICFDINKKSEKNSRF
jgi:UDP-N-acetyl-D-mannosaminuronate dehydrogenase